MYSLRCKFKIKICEYNIEKHCLSTSRAENLAAYNRKSMDV